MVELFILMMERVGLIILLAFLLVNVPYFKRVLLSREKMSSKVQLILILVYLLLFLILQVSKSLRIRLFPIIY